MMTGEKWDRQPCCTITWVGLNWNIKLFANRWRWWNPSHRGIAFIYFHSSRRYSTWMENRIITAWRLTNRKIKWRSTLPEMNRHKKNIRMILWKDQQSAGINSEILYFLCASIVQTLPEVWLFLCRYYCSTQYSISRRLHLSSSFVCIFTGWMDRCEFLGYQSD